MRSLRKINSISEFSISNSYQNFYENLKKIKRESSLTISLFNFYYFPDEDEKKVEVKTENEDKKNWKNEFDF